MKKIRVAINGLGRIGRGVMRHLFDDEMLEVVAINDLAEPEALAYLLQYDSVYGKAPFEVGWNEEALIVGEREIPVSRVAEIEKLPWGESRIDIVVEATGRFTTYREAGGHIKAGAKRVVITAPAKDDEGGATVLMGVNNEMLATCKISSNASCTTNASSPLIAILDESIGIEKAILNTAHAMTNSQAVVDTPKKDKREGRAASVNIIPAPTGAAIAVTNAFTALQGKFDGIAMRVPVACGSLVDVTFIAKRDTSVEEVNDILRRATEDSRWEGIFTITEDEPVSSDIIGAPYGAIADLHLTRVVGGNLVKVCAWYDNEMGYVATLARHLREVATYL